MPFSFHASFPTVPYLLSFSPRTLYCSEEYVCLCSYADWKSRSILGAVAQCIETIPPFHHPILENDWGSCRCRVDRGGLARPRKERTHAGSPAFNTCLTLRHR